jgi:hypothetical protein
MPGDRTHRGTRPRARRPASPGGARAAGARREGLHRADDAFVELVTVLGPHVRKEERGIFAAMSSAGDFAPYIAELTGEHHAIHDHITRADVRTRGQGSRHPFRLGPPRATYLERGVGSVSGSPRDHQRGKLRRHCAHPPGRRAVGVGSVGVSAPWQFWKHVSTRSLSKRRRLLGPTGYYLPPSTWAIRILTFRTSAAGKGLSVGNRIVPFPVSYFSSSRSSSVGM